MVAFGFWHRGGLGVAFCIWPESGSSNSSRLHYVTEVGPQWDQSLPQVHQRGTQVPLCLPWPPRSAPGSVSSEGWWWRRQSSLLIGRLQQLTTQNRQTRLEGVPSNSALIITALQEPPRGRKGQKNIKHSGNSTFDEFVNNGWQTQPWSVARELWDHLRDLGYCPVCGRRCGRPPLRTSAWWVECLAS